MAKKITAFFCRECGHESAKWMGQCPACRAWNTFVEEKISPVTQKAKPVNALIQENGGITRLSEVIVTDEDRIHTGISELDRVLGGGIIRGGLCLVGGDPGIGKSTLLLQMCRNLANDNRKVLYVSGEESAMQIKMRADRLGGFRNDIDLLARNDLEGIIAVIEENRPEVVIIDSIQTMMSEASDSAAGSVSQVREATQSFLRVAKVYGISIFIIGHVTKEGVVAGPRVLEHMVDTVLYFEGDNQACYRILRAVKNRFGSTNEIGVFSMNSSGLEEVVNPSEYMLNGKPEKEPGSVVTCCMEGSRPILVEVQALVCQTNFSMPRRTAVGADYNRVNLLMAVMEKRMGIQFSGCDAYVNIAGGMKINEPSLDVAIVAALLSSYKNRSFTSKVLAFGETGLTGEVRAVSGAAQRVREAVKLGYDHIIMPLANFRTLPDEIKNDPQVCIFPVANIRDIGEVVQ